MRIQVPGSELVVNIGTRKQLFVDDHIIETTRWISPRLSETARWVQPPARPRTDLDGWSEGVDRIEEDIPGELLRATAFVMEIRSDRIYARSPFGVARFLFNDKGVHRVDRT